MSYSYFQSDVRLPKPSRPPERPPQPSRSHTPVITSIPPSAVDWSVKPIEKEKYEKLFDSLQPTNGLIPGNKVKKYLQHQSHFVLPNWKKGMTS